MRAIFARKKEKDESVRKVLNFVLGFSLALVMAHYFLPFKAQIILACIFPEAAVVAIFLRGNVRLRTILICLGISVGFAWNAAHFSLFIAPAQIYAGARDTVCVRVTDYPIVSDSYSRISVKLVEDGYPEVNMYVYDYYNGAFSELLPGDEILIDLRFTSALIRAGAETDSYISNGIYLRAYLDGGYEFIGTWKYSFLYFPREIAQAVKSSAMAVFPADVAPFMKALLTGDKTDLYEQKATYTYLQIAGITHVVAVSGMHVAFLIAALRAASGRRRRTAMIGIPAMLFFMAMMGFTPSVTRAGVMQIVFMAAPLLRREADSATTLCVPLLAMLLLNPQAIGSVSLQLSFAAMVGLHIFALPVRSSLMRLVPPPEKSERIYAALYKPIKGIASVTSCSVGAIILTIPLTSLHFGFVSLYSIFTNVLCMWAISVAFTVGYAVCLVGIVLPGLASVAGAIIGVLPRFVIFASELLAQLPYAALYTSSNLITWWLIFAYVLFTAFYYFSRREGVRVRPVFPICILLIALCAVVLSNMAAVTKTPRLTAIDVGQGQAVAVLQSGSTVLIDCGNTHSAEDAGAITAAYLLGQGRATIDLLILTHMHTDHVDGVESLIYRMNVRRIILPEEQTDSEHFEAISHAAALRGTEIILLNSDSLVMVDDLSLTLFAPMGSAGTNERGIIILGSYGEFDFLVTGDVDSKTESVLVSAYDLPQVELLLAGHHGSRYSTGYDLLDETNPEYVFISVGYNSYGHPTQEVILRASEYNAAIYRTDKSGNISITMGK